LWVAGWPIPARSLHHQLILGQDIFLAERMDLHLVWTAGRIFLKPIPRFLLEPSFWTDHLASSQECILPYRHGLRAWALGLLYSYTALIGHESYFFIAKSKHLLPEEVDWQGWRTLVQQVLQVDDTDRKVDSRLINGELRLGRLNKIYKLSRGPFLRGYMP
ncbi:hypothetical protein M406DRAFT_249419, partial [Cryphonectria parasitica EP155]